MIYKFICILTCALLSHSIQAQEQEQEFDPAEIAIGERLTLETRFAQAFFQHRGKADPALDTTQSSRLVLKGAFAGNTMNCRACHLVDEFAEQADAGMRSYADFASRPPIPARDDRKLTSLRNSMSMVNISIPRQQGELFHFDGEFNSLEDLVRATLTGRNYGWLTSEKGIAIRHIASIIRDDDGSSPLAQSFGGAYRKILKATDSDIPAHLRLPEKYRIDVTQASDNEILDAISQLVTAYITNLTFSRQQGAYDASPYDLFLAKNNLPAIPAPGETITHYNQRLIEALSSLEQVKFVSKDERSYRTHQQDFAFGEDELIGMKLFFSRGNESQHGGNCFSCHSAPHFSDFSFHNSGLTQQNYDHLHGAGKFSKLSIPSLAARNVNYDKYLPSTPEHPQASSMFRTFTDKDNPNQVDLGLWNVFANPDMPAPQQKLFKLICDQAGKLNTASCTRDQLLPLTIAAFKTPVLRDLGHSDPYMHTGQFENLHQAVGMYQASAALAKSGKMRNADNALKAITLDDKDINYLVAFLKALNEDYE